MRILGNSEVRAYSQGLWLHFQAFTNMSQIYRIFFSNGHIFLPNSMFLFKIKVRGKYIFVEITV